MSPGCLPRETSSFASVMQDRARCSGWRNALRASSGLLPGKGQQHHEVLYLGGVRQRPGFVDGLELFQGHAEQAPGTLVERLSMLRASDCAGVGPAKKVHRTPFGAWPLSWLSPSGAQG